TPTRAMFRRCDGAFAVFDCPATKLGRTIKAPAAALPFFKKSRLLIVGELLWCCCIKTEYSMNWLRRVRLLARLLGALGLSSAYLRNAESQKGQSKSAITAL